MSTSGDVIRLGIDGRTYRVIGGTDITRNPKKKREGMPTSGGTLFKETFNIPSQDGFKIELASEEYAVFENNVNQIRDMPLWIEYVGGRICECTGRVAIENWTSQENTCTVNLIPSASSGWADSVR